MDQMSDDAALAPPMFVDKLVQLSSGGNGRKALKHNQLLRLVSEALSSAPSKDPFLYSLACIKSLGEGAFTPAQQNSIGHLFVVATDQCERAPAYASRDRAVSRKEAASLVALTLEGKLALESRLVVRVAALFGVKSPDLPASANKRAPHFAQRLITERNYAAGMGLTQQLELGPKVAESLLVQMIEDNAASAAMDWAKQFGKEVGARLISRLGELGNHKVAWQLIQGLGLEDSFPGAYIRYRKTSITKCAKKGIWEVAKSLAEEDPILMEHLVETAIVEEEFRLAIECAERFGLDPLLTDDVLAASGLPSETNCLKLPIPLERVVFVDTPEGLLDAQKEICDSDFVGLDSEWKADQVRGAPLNPVALLQLATRGGAWLVDLIALAKSAPGELDAFLASVFCNPDILKLGFAVNGDLDRISRTHPELRNALSTCGPILDLAALAKARGLRSRSLAGICHACIGKPLSKRVRMSNWEQRPLSEVQQHYAALDALCLIPLFDLLSDPAFVAPDESNLGKSADTSNGTSADASKAAEGESLSARSSEEAAVSAGNGAALRIVREPSGALLSVSEPSDYRVSQSSGREQAGLAALLPPASARLDTPPTEVSAAAERAQDAPADLSNNEEAVSRSKLRKPWQALVYSYNAKSFPDGQTRRQKRRFEKHGPETPLAEGGLSGKEEQGLEAGCEDIGASSMKLQGLEPALDIEAAIEGEEDSREPGLEESLAVTSTAEVAGSAPETLDSTVRVPAGSGADEKARYPENGAEELGVWAGLGLPERVADALHQGGLTFDQVSVLRLTEEQEGSEIERETTSANELPVHRETGRSKEHDSEKQNAEASSADEESGALDKWRAAKRAESGQAAVEESGHVASNERPTWQVRCIPVLISVLEEASAVDGLDAGSSASSTSSVEQSSSGARAPSAEVGSGAPMENGALTEAKLSERQSKKQRLKLVVALVDKGQRTDLAAVAKHLGMPGRAVWLASEEECMTHFGFPTSLLPPLGHLKKAAVAFDSSLRSDLITANARLVTASGERGVNLAWEVPPLVQKTHAVTRDFVLTPKGGRVSDSNAEKTRTENGASDPTARLEEDIEGAPQEETQFGELQSSAVEANKGAKNDLIDKRSEDKQHRAVSESSSETSSPCEATSSVVRSSTENKGAANFNGPPHTAETSTNSRIPADKVGRRRFKLQKALLRKSPSAGTGKLVGLQKRKELETLSKALGRPSRGTRGVSTGLGAGFRGLEQTPTSGEEGLKIDLRQCFAPAWVGVPEGRRPFWKAHLRLLLARSNGSTLGQNTQPPKAAASRRSSIALHSTPSGDRSSATTEKAAFIGGLLLLPALWRFLYETRIGSQGLSRVILSRPPRLMWQRWGISRGLSRLVPTNERWLQRSAFQLPDARLVSSPPSATLFCRGRVYRRPFVLVGGPKTPVWRQTRSAKGQSGPGLSSVWQVKVGRPLAVCRCC